MSTENESETIAQKFDEFMQLLIAALTDEQIDEVFDLIVRSPLNVKAYLQKVKQQKAIELCNQQATDYAQKRSSFSHTASVLVGVWIPFMTIVETWDELARLCGSPRKVRSVVGDAVKAIHVRPLRS